MQDRPDAGAIMDIAIAHLRDNVAPHLDGRAKFEMRVALGALALVQRTLMLTPESDAAERARLEAILSERGELETLNRRLCERIREGAITFDTPRLAAHMRATALEKLAVDQPTYSAYRRAIES